MNEAQVRRMAENQGYEPDDTEDAVDAWACDAVQDQRDNQEETL